MATELQISGLPLAMTAALALTDQMPFDNASDVTFRFTRAQYNTFLASYFTTLASIQDQTYVYFADTGAANAYVLTPSPALSAYADGQMLSFVSANANTGASTIAVSGLSAKAIVTNDGAALNANAILANGSYNIQYSSALGGKFVLLNPSIPLGGGYLPLAGGTMSGAINMGSNQINAVSDPTHAQDAVTVHYAGLTYLALAGGTMTGAINMGTYNITNLADPVNAQDAATKNYVSTIAAGLNPVDGVYAASTANLTSWTYNNGSAGVGATLTAPGNGVFTVDGVSPPVGSRFLYKNDTTYSGVANGIYTVTTSTSGSPAVLTRATDYNTPSAIQVGDLISVQNGTANAISSWYQTATVVTIGVSAISYSVWFNPASYVSSSLPSGTIFIGNGSGVAVPSTATYPNTVTINSLMYASAANTWTALATANNSVLVTSNTGVPSYSTSLPSGLTIPSPRVTTGIYDSNGNLIFALGVTASAVNYVEVSNQATGQPPNLSAAGSDTNITLVLHGKGTGGVNMDGSYNGSSPGQGYVGYSLSSNIAAASPVSLSNDSAKDVTHITLAAGNYVAYGNVAFVGNTGTCSAAQAWLSSSSASSPDVSLLTQTVSIGTSNNSGIALAPKYFNFTGAGGTIYLSTLAVFTAALNVCGNLTIIQMP